MEKIQTKKYKIQHPMNPWYLPYLFSLPVILVLLFIVVIPLIFGFMISAYNIKLENIRLLQKIGINIFKLPLVLKNEFIGLQNYIEILTDKSFWLVFLRTIIWTVVNVFFHVVLGVWLAVTLNRKLPGKPLFRVLLILPWAIPQYIAVLTWRIMFNYEYGMINLILNKLHLPAVNWLGDNLAFFIACIITNIWLGVPFMMMTASGGLQSIPASVYEAADIDGATPWQKFIHITVPLLKPVMLPAIMLGTVWTFNMINIIYLMEPTGRPTDDVNILVVKMYKDGFDLYRYGYAAAMAVIIFLILAIFSIFYMKITKSAEEA